jgi:hypothetical protein
VLEKDLAANIGYTNGIIEGGGVSCRWATAQADGQDEEYRRFTYA